MSRFGDDAFFASWGRHTGNYTRKRPFHGQTCAALDEIFPIRLRPLGLMSQYEKKV
ncbi:hypothetical protein SELSPUOL_01453 [Selenomonas sputigena ATCC 35185]|uniref:Uncharacterized protein n=1 Tax=Selenomonas sputigena (strain ATCC 35185 / DSM 20758 / CCUG 44933 / VPI D19B-28) TaxID=546271 RepID=C9LVF9_SELS3|nr:hypothetical protein SELSPUOL_01453 [Selenomonas sputigena ATCC 35185]